MLDRQVTPISARFQLLFDILRFVFTAQEYYLKMGLVFLLVSFQHPYQPVANPFLCFLIIYRLAQLSHFVIENIIDNRRLQYVLQNNLGDPADVAPFIFGKQFQAQLFRQFAKVLTIHQLAPDLQSLRFALQHHRHNLPVFSIQWHLGGKMHVKQTLD